MTVKLTSPHSFPERFLLFGGGGAGKTETVLNIASHLAHGTMHVLDVDYSRAYERALATTHQDAADRVALVETEPEWGPFTAALAKTIDAADPEDDWVVIDPISSSYDAVQSWYLEQVYGHDLASHIVELRKTHADDLKAYHKALADDMNWNAVKKEYSARVWSPLSKWRGHLILVAEAKALNNERDEQIKMLFGPLGFKPAGQALTPHVAATNLFLDHPRRDLWRITTVKDRNREEVDKMHVDDFGIDYLVGVAGWERARKGQA